MTTLPLAHPAPGNGMPDTSNVHADRIRGEWANISDKILRRWNKLTPDDVRFPDGSSEYLARVLQDRYGLDRHEALLQVYEFESGL